MARYRCKVCGDIYDEEKEGVRFEDLPDDWVCPFCRSPKKEFVLEGASEGPAEPEENEAPSESFPEDVTDLGYDPNLVRRDGGQMDEIHFMAVKGKSIGEAMDTLMPIPNFDRIIVLGGQLAHPPKDDYEEVSIRTVIGKDAKHPMVIESPVYISHMSFGALSGRAKIALAKGAAMACTAVCSGEGGALYDEMKAS